MHACSLEENLKIPLAVDYIAKIITCYPAHLKTID